MNPQNSTRPSMQDSPQVDVPASEQVSAYDALGFLSHAAQESRDIPSSPEYGTSNQRRTRPSLSPIRKVRRPDSTTMDPADQTSDEEANLVVVENPDGSLLEGMPSGFKHLTPEASAPHTPRTLNFALTGVDLVDLFNRHERIFLGLLLITILVDAIIITEEFTTVIGAIINMTSRSNGAGVNWSGKLGNVLPFMERGPEIEPSDTTLADSHVRQTFSVFPPHWSFAWAFGTAWVDLFMCLIFFVAGFFAYVSKQRRSYSWFSTVACIALIWQVVLSCVDKLSLLLFLARLACFTHSRFMGDLMDDISVLATLMGPRGSDITEALLESEQIPLAIDIAEENGRGRPPL